MAEQRYRSMTPEELQEEFLQAKDNLQAMREELFERGFWVDAKYNISEIQTLNDDHLQAIIRMLKNNAIRRSQKWRGLQEKAPEQFLVEHPAYPALRREAIARTMPGSDTLPEAVV